MCAGQGTVKELHAVEVRSVGDTGDFRGHGLVFGINDQALRGVVRAGGGLFGQFLHADELFVDDAESAVSGLDQGDGVVGVAHTLVQRGHVGPHQFANGETGRVVSGAVDAQTRRKALHGLAQIVVVGTESARGVAGHRVGVDSKGHAIPP